MQIVAIVIVVLIVIGLLVDAFVLRALVGQRNKLNAAWADLKAQLGAKADVATQLADGSGDAAAVGATAQAMTGTDDAVEAAQAHEKLVAELGSQAGAGDADQARRLESLTAIDDKLAVARRDYNDEVVAYNERITRVPGSILAQVLGFRVAKQFDPSPEAADQPDDDAGE